MLKRFVFLMILMLSSLPLIYAQEETPELTQSYTFEDTGYSIFFPEGWRTEEDEEGVIYLTDDNYYFDFDFYVPDLQAERDYPQGDLEGLSELLFYAGDEAITFSFADAVERTVNGETIYEYEFTDVNSEGSEFPKVYYTRLMEDGTFVIGFVYPVSGSDPIPDDVRDLGAAMTASFSAGEGGTVTTADAVSEAAEGETPYGFEKQFTFDSGFVIYFPADWDAFLNDEGILRLDNGDYTLEFDFYDPVLLEEQEVPADDLLAAAESVFGAYDASITFDSKVVTTMGMEDTEVVVFDFNDTNADGQAYPTVYITFYQPNGTFVLGYLYPNFGDEPIPTELYETAFQILNSITPPAE